VTNRSRKPYIAGNWKMNLDRLKSLDLIKTIKGRLLHRGDREVAFFAPGNDPAVWRNGWFAPVAQMQSAATRASPVERWWSAGRAPMLVVQGVQDAVAPPENGRALAAEFGARVILHEIDGAGHAMLPERPEEIAARVLEFLARVAR